MRIISKRTLRQFWLANPSAGNPLKSWYAESKNAIWDNPNEVLKSYRSADIVGDKIVFNIGGNKYRLIVKINYKANIIYILWVGTHEEYNHVDVKRL